MVGGTVVGGTVVGGTVVGGTVVGGTVVGGTVVGGTVVGGTVVGGTVVGGAVVGMVNGSRIILCIRVVSPCLTRTWLLHGVYPSILSSTVLVPMGTLSMTKAFAGTVFPLFCPSMYTIAPEGSESRDIEPVRGVKLAVMDWLKLTS